MRREIVCRSWYYTKEVPSVGQPHVFEVARTHLRHIDANATIDVSTGREWIRYRLTALVVHH